MTEQQTVPAAGVGFTPSDEDRRGIEEWFARYDALSAAGEVESMADMAVFPLNVVTSDSAGDGLADQWSRERFTRTMSEVLGGGGDGGITFESVRTPHFLTAELAVVVTEATMTAGGHTEAMRYADVLVKRGGSWFFQTMIQGGWGDALRQSAQ
ncbi:hypothetical protein [Streptomyces sp. Ru87]|uniref:hypothetical protein n=1 Tax=Streptomyces sp. Ru87 TaxID=2044307 RepID=UPI000BFA1453|nr:hypothetical protein [Streptomyces sp. Ru87]PGH51421.1 hypothetical protein CRI70_06755 [Streptomyces sp. Ru87]